MEFASFPPPQATPQPKVLNVGGNNKSIPLPPIFDGYEHLLLDIDPTGNPDVLCDARELTTLEAGQFDAIYCSHNLEHYWWHDVPRVLAGFVHVLKKPQGFAFVRVPDIQEVMKVAVQRGMEPDDVLYNTASGVPIAILDVLYGWRRQIEQSGVDFFAHKTGFSPKLLNKTLYQAGFARVYISSGNLEVRAMAFLGVPDAATRQKFGLPAVDS